MGLVLEMVEVVDRWHWRWLLTDEQTRRPLAEHRVAVDPGAAEAGAFEDLHRYLRWTAEPDRRTASEAELLAKVGAWIGHQVLGEHVGQAIVDIADTAPVTVRVVVPPEAEFMLFRPLELAHVNGAPLASYGKVTLVFDLNGGTGTGATAAPKAPVVGRLRMLAVFSQPTNTSALALRRERYALTRLIRRIAARQQRAVEVRVVQYGVTRQRLAEVVQSRDGWDVLHLSGHGEAGAFLLEKPDGSPDVVTTPELVGLLRPARQRVKLAVVSACHSAAAITAQTLRQLGLDQQAEELEAQANQEAGPPPSGGPARGLLTAIAPELVRQLDCAVVAMRYRVSDDFAIALAEELYERLFGDRPQTLDTALSGAVAQAAGPHPTTAQPALSVATPAVFGLRAAGLSLTPPKGEVVLDPQQKPMAFFPDEPERFVGRARVMAAASAALAPESGRSAVVVHGMAGAGKTACALELAYRHQDSFATLAFWEAPQRAEEFGGALAGLAVALERQLADYGFTIVDKIATVEQLEGFLPQMKALLQDHRLLLVLDNLETLLTSTGAWRDPRWAPLVAALTGHHGESRVIFTSRIPPAGLEGGRMLVLPVHALARDEALALARELPYLRKLLHGKKDRELVRRVLHIVQGHPKLLELANAAAQHPAQLHAHLDAAQAAGPDQGELSAFLDGGVSDLEAAQFLKVLAHWTRSTLETLPEDAALLLRMLCCLEDHDRRSAVVQGNWADVWRRLDRPGDPPDLAIALRTLTAAALIHPESLGPAGSADQGGDGEAVAGYRVHPGIAETVRAATEAALQSAVDTELAAYWDMVALAARGREGAEVGQVVVYAGVAAAPYLLRLQHWDTAGWLLEEVMRRDDSPWTRQVVVAHLRRIADATGAPKDLSVLGQALLGSDPAEAERLLREALQQALASQDYRLASATSGYLVTLLRGTGRLREALALAEERVSYAQRAGLGPWSQLVDQGQRLWVLMDLGEHERVLAEIARLREAMAALPDQAAANETATPWNVRETILDVGAHSALALGRWRECLEFNAEILTSKRRRNAGLLALADTRFNDYGPLSRLGRWKEAEQAVLAFQQAAEDHNDIPRLARAFSVRADLEGARGRVGAAVSFQRTGLRYRYTRPAPREIATDHHNLALYLSGAGGDAGEQRAHRLAAALLSRLTGRAHDLQRTIRVLARELHADGDRSDRPATTGEVIALVERTEGVHLAALLTALGADQHTTDHALAEILRTARDPHHTAVDVQGHLQRWEPVIAAVVAAAGGDHQAAQTLAPVLEQMADTDEWAALAGVLRQIIAGHRGRDLLAGLDPIDTAIAGEVLRRLTGGGD